MAKNWFKKFGFKIGSAITILILSIIIFSFYIKSAGVLFLLLTVFIYLTFIFKVKWVERFFAGLLAISIFWFDVLQNKLSQNGLDYEVHITTATVRAIPLFYIALTIIVFILGFLMVRAIINNKGHRVRDIIFGIVGFIAIIFLYAMAMLSFYFEPTKLIPFFGTELALITLYHFLGIFILLSVMLYYIITD